MGVPWLTESGRAVSYNQPKARKFFCVTGTSQPFDNTALLLSNAVFPSSRSRRFLRGIANFFLPRDLW